MDLTQKFPTQDRAVFYLIVIQDIPEEKEYDPVGGLGIDLGIEILL